MTSDTTKPRSTLRRTQQAKLADCIYENAVLFGIGYTISNVLTEGMAPREMGTKTT